MTSFADFEKLIERTLHTNHLRYGQIVMNILHDVWPEKYKQLLGTNMDCFYYNDQDTSRVVAYLEREWKDQIGRAHV